MKIQKSLMRLISLLIIPCFLGACTGYNRVVLPIDQRLPVEQKIVVLHSGTDEFCLYGVEITDSHIRGTIRSLDSVPRIQKKMELRIYVVPTFEMPAPLPATTSIPFTAIERVEVYDVSTGKTVFYAVAIALGVLVLAVIIVAALKSSCPFIYAFDGERYEFAGEIFSGTIYPPLERHDYLPLPTLKAADGEYRIKLANDVREVQHTNLTELWVIDHPRGAEVLVDKYGVPHTLTDLHSPTEAVTLRGEDVGDRIAAADEVIYMGAVAEEVSRDVDGVVLTFDRPPEASEAKLVFQGKNSFWLDYVYGQFADLFGDHYNEWYEEQKEARAEDLLQWSLEQGIPLAVYVEDAGEWRFVDYYHIAGPMAARRDVLAFELPASDVEEVRVKLEFGPMFWEIDYVGLDFSADLPVQLYSIPPASAIAQDGRDVSGLLFGDDDRYYVQPEVGEYAFIAFLAPGATEGMARSTFLHSKGHYEISRDPQGKPDLTLLYSFKKAGRFIEFSRELFLHYYETMVSREG